MEDENVTKSDESTNKKETDKVLNESETLQNMTILMPKDTILECWLCGSEHSTEKCPKITAAHKVQDKPIPSNARLSLPDSLLIVKLEDPVNRLMVVAKTSILCNTIFGPLEAPKILDTEIHTGYKVNMILVILDIFMISEIHLALST